MLLKDDVQVDGSISCESLLQDSAELKLVILENTYIVKRNVPYISNIALPTSMLVGFPIYPTKFESLYTDKRRSIFNWYRNNAVNNKSNLWVHVSEGYLYVPSVSDIGCNLKINCVPRNESDSGCNIEVESKNTVEAGPGLCPFDIRHKFTKNRLSGKRYVLCKILYMLVRKKYKIIYMYKVSEYMSAGSLGLTEHRRFAILQLYKILNY